MASYRGRLDLDRPHKGVMAALYDASGARLDVSVTDEDGFYEFLGLSSASYTVKFFGRDYTSKDDLGISVVGDFDAEVSANTDVVANKLKLTGIDPGATANATDANLRDRTTHSGLQAASTISDFDVTVSGNSSVVANTSKLSGIDPGATANDTNANLRDRTTHSGLQAASTISDFDVTVSGNSSVVANTSKLSGIEENATAAGDSWVYDDWSTSGSGNPTSAGELMFKDSAGNILDSTSKWSQADTIDLYETDGNSRELSTFVKNMDSGDLLKVWDSSAPLERYSIYEFKHLRDYGTYYRFYLKDTDETLNQTLPSSTSTSFRFEVIHSEGQLNSKVTPIFLGGTFPTDTSGAYSLYTANTDMSAKGSMPMWKSPWGAATDADHIWFSPFDHDFYVAQVRIWIDNPTGGDRSPGTLRLKKTLSGGTSASTVATITDSSTTFPHLVEKSVPYPFTAHISASDYHSWIVEITNDPNSSANNSYWVVRVYVVLKPYLGW